MHVITAVTNPVWGDAAHTSVLCDVTTEEAGTHPFNCMANDPEPHGQQLWKDLSAGKYGVINAYIAAPAPTTAKPVSAKVVDP